MDNLRFFGLAAGLFIAVFFGMKRLLTVEPLKPDARLPMFQRVDANDPRTKLMQSPASDDDATRDRLRHDVLDSAEALNDDPYNAALKARYIEAASNHAKAWISIAPCFSSLTCNNSSWKTIENAQHALGSPLDARERLAIYIANLFIGIFSPTQTPISTASSPDKTIGDDAHLLSVGGLVLVAIFILTLRILPRSHETHAEPEKTPSGRLRARSRKSVTGSKVPQWATA